MCCPGLIWPLKVWYFKVFQSNFPVFVTLFLFSSEQSLSRSPRSLEVESYFIWFWFLERCKARTTGGQSQILNLSRNQNQTYFPGLTFSRDVVLWVGYRRIDTPVLDKVSEVKGCVMVLIPWEIKGLYCMWFIADLTSPEELWVRVCCRGWYEGDIKDGVGGWCFTTFLTFSTFYNIWLLFYNVQCVGYAFKSNLVAFVSIFLLLWIFKCLFKESTWEDE